MKTVHENAGDALRADRIAVKARRMSAVEVQHGSAKHRIQTSTLEDEAYCVIEVPLVYFRK